MSPEQKNWVPDWWKMLLHFHQRKQKKRKWGCNYFGAVIIANLLILVGFRDTFDLWNMNENYILWEFKWLTCWKSFDINCWGLLIHNSQRFHNQLSLAQIILILPSLSTGYGWELQTLSMLISPAYSNYDDKRIKLNSANSKDGVFARAEIK